MDKLAKQLKTDAAMIDVQVSDELERRITASLHSVTPETPQPRTEQARPASFWWASSLTGIAAALALIAMINSRSPLDDEPLVQVAETSLATEVMIPAIVWKAESAMLTRPLQKELEDLQADLKKAEEKVKSDIGL